MDMPNIEKKYEIIVIDSAAFIKGAKIDNQGKEFYTIPEVIGEIKDKQARGLLERFPYEIKMKEPSEESIKTVAQFARSTGDISHISSVDLKVMALTYQLEVELNGDSEINKEPVDISRYFKGTKELRTVGVNVSNTLCEYYNSESGCMFGNACRNRHPNDVVPKITKEIKCSKQENIINTNTTTSTSIENNNNDNNDNNDNTDSNKNTPEKPKSTFKGWAIPVMKSSTTADEDFPTLEEASKQFPTEEISKETKEKIYQQFVFHKTNTSATNKNSEKTVENEAAQSEIIDTNNSDNVQDDSKNINTSINTEVSSVVPSETESNIPKEKKAQESRILVSNSLATTEFIDENDNEGWASTDNLNDGWGVWASGEKPTDSLSTNNKEDDDENDENEYHHIACCTADYTMQNVLLQMGLKILSIEGLRVKTVKLWTHRCRLCYTVCRDLSKLFCPHCGHDSLARVPLFIDKYGRTKIGEIRTNPKLRGTIYSVSKEQRGMGGILTSADQLETGIWKQRVLQSKHSNGNAMNGMNEVLTETFGAFRSSNPNNNIVIGFGRKNPNEMKGRERRGKKHRNH